MSRNGGALDRPPKAADSNDSSNNAQTPDNDNPLLLQSGTELSNPNNRITNRTLDRTSLDTLSSVDNLYASLTTPKGLTDAARTSGTDANATKQSSTSGQADDFDPNIDTNQKYKDDYPKDKYNLPSEDEPLPHPETEKKLIKYFRPIEIKIHGIIDGSTGSGNLEEAKANFLKVFREHGGNASKAESYIDNMINIHHRKAEYAKQHPKKKVFYVKDKDLAACINEYAKVPGAKRTGTAAEFSNAEINGKLLRLVGAIGIPEKKINQGQIGSCALHAGVGYVIEKSPKDMARVGGQILRTGEYRGTFTKRDMSSESGQTDMDHILGTAMLRNVYKAKHLNSGYGGTDDVNLAKGIKRLTHGKVHAVWSDGKTESNGADLDITYGGSHCQRSICRVFKEDGKLVMKKKTDNTWGNSNSNSNGYSDGRWKAIG